MSIGTYIFNINKAIFQVRKSIFTIVNFWLKIPAVYKNGVIMKVLKVMLSKSTERRTS